MSEKWSSSLIEHSWRPSSKPTAGQPESLLQRRSHDRFFDAWEDLDIGARAEAIRSRLNEYIELARGLDFYRPRLVNYDAHSDTPLAKVPVLTANELRDQLPPDAKNTIVRPNQGFNVFQSGGTTGAPKTTLFSDLELEALAHPNARGFFASGLRAEDRVANLFAVGGLYMTFIHIHRMLQQYGCMNFPFSNHTPVDFIHTVAKMFQINTIAGIGSVGLSALRGMSELGLDGIKIEKFYYGGERLYAADEDEVRSRFGTKIIRAPGYGTVDTWYIGYQCERAPLGVFHAHDDQCYIEIVDEDEDGRACALGEVGMMLATPFPRRLTPVVRYRVGDLAKWVGANCECGRKTPLFELLGRGDDVLRIGYDSIDYNFLQERISTFSHQHKTPLSGVIQMQKLREEGKDRLVIRVEAEVPVEARAAVAHQLAEMILEVRPSLREFVKKGSVLPLIVEILPNGSLKRNSRTGKLVRVIDSV